MDPVALRCELLNFGNVEAMDSNKSFLSTLSIDGDLYLLYQTEEAKHVKINRDFSFIKVTSTESKIVVLGWKESTKEATFLLYDNNLRFRDEVSLKLGNIILSR